MAEPIDSWFRRFVPLHQRINPSNQYYDFDPIDMSDFWQCWLHEFRRQGVTAKVALEASYRVAGDHPQVHPAAHLGRLLKHARDIAREQGRDGDDVLASDRETAVLQSKDCADCGGQGLTLRWRTMSPEKNQTPHITLYCLCVYGRYLERTHRIKTPEVRKRLYDLMDYPWLHHACKPWVELENDVPVLAEVPAF